MRIRKLLDGLGKPIVLFYALPWLMMLLVLGTLAQRQYGLYVSQKMFFSSFMFWWGPVPLPGMLSVLALLGISLLTKIILKSPWRMAAAGTLIVHLGALLLLFGGLLTAATALEGNMALAAGDAQNYFTDYYRRELVIEKNGAAVQTINFDDLRTDGVLENPNLPFHITIEKICRNCGLVARHDGAAEYHGLAAKVDLCSQPPSKQDEENLSGAVFKVKGVGAADGHYATFEDAREQPAFKTGADSYRIFMQKHPYSLPFSVRLDTLSEQTYPGTDIAKEYESHVTVTDGALQFPARIRMNEPLRYRGYTFYQAEFNAARGRPFSVLAVVHNTGRALPYVASIVMCLGMILHLFLMRRRAP